MCSMTLVSLTRLINIFQIPKRNTYQERPQILSITCDNASANDAMIDHLAILLEAFPGSANCTRCFTHILNLVAKCILKQFDAPKKQKSDDDDMDEEDAMDLQVALDELENELENDGVDEDNNNWEYNMRIAMTEDEIEELEKAVKPVRRVLTKVLII